jgi:hypothetical protein
MKPICTQLHTLDGTTKLVECGAPGAHCGGAGFQGGTLSGVGWSGGGGRRKLPRSRRQHKSRDFEPISPFTLSGRVAFHLKGSRIDRPDEGVAHWFASKLGMLSKQEEKYSIEEFLEKFSRFLAETYLQNILGIEMDYHTVYKDKEKTTTNDLHDSIAEARDYISHHRDVNKVVVSALGRTKIEPRKDLHLTVEGQYYRRHGFGKPGIELRVTALPSALLPHKKETTYEYKARQAELARTLAKARKRDRFHKGCEKTLEIILRDYGTHMKNIFDIDNVEISNERKVERGTH